ncbi:membrane protein [Devosia geojensis]|uniref:Membrane protein n=1 Tax=Devosia geojensis TaxID=443610 RepID=A0A0F5FNW4_9HYPH|nr:DMT family transporter [Devosia geojensis]KKB10521.1 membrane protein [Devosia geojensis]
MPLGVVLAFLAYASFSMGDALIKGLGPHLSVFEIAFFTTGFSIIPAIIANRGERWREMFKMKHPYLLQLRCVTAILGSACVIYAFTHIAFAEVYAITFTTPVFVTLLSVFLLKESVSRLRWILLLIGFIGVLLVVRPGFRALELGHLAALACACLGSVTTTILRHIAPHEKRVSLVGVVVLYSVVFNGILMLPTFVVPTLEQMGMFMLVGGVGGVGGLLLIAAARRVPANLVAPVQYSQLIWAIIFGALFYSEFPDGLAIVGLLIVVGAGLLNVLVEKRPIRWKPRVFFYRSGL